MWKTITKTQGKVLEKLGFESMDEESYELNLADITAEDTNGTVAYNVCDEFELKNLIKNMYADAFLAGQMSVRKPIIQALNLWSD